MNVDSLTSPGAVLVAGLLTSLHCVGMCGPLACTLLPKEHVVRATVCYHFGRAVSYIAVGGILGGVGKKAAAIFQGNPAQAMPYVLIALFVIIGLGWEKKLPVPAFVSRFFLKLRLAPKGGVHPAFLLGIASPLLPCAPLYLVFGVAIFSGSIVAGAFLMGCFVIGTIPLYAFFQSQYGRLRLRFPAWTFVWFQRGMAWISVVLITWRAVESHGQGLALKSCPLCP